MSYRIASFNVRNLSYGSGRDLDRIARIIKDNKLDIVALQEVLSEGKILTGPNLKDLLGQAKALDYSLKGRLGKNYEICWRDPATKSKYYPYLGEDSRGEGYAFIWDTRKFELLKDEAGNEILPTIWRNYGTNSSEKQIRLIRDPCYGRFKIKNGKAEIRLITTHIVYKKPKDDLLDADLDFGAIQMRINEFNVIAGKIYPKISEYYKDINCCVPYTIILGDYNLNLRSSGLGKAILQDVVCFDAYGHPISESTNSYCKIFTVQEQLTTLKIDGSGYASNYDHFSYDQRVKEEIIKGGPYRIEVQSDGTEDERTKFENYRQKVSDHVPVYVEIGFR